MLHCAGHQVHSLTLTISEKPIQCSSVKPARAAGSGLASWRRKSSSLRPTSQGCKDACDDLQDSKGTV